MKKICIQPYAARDEVRTYQELPSGTCPVRQVLQMLQEAREQSCGLGVFCRDGLTQLLQICRDAVTSHGRGEEDLKLMREICEMTLLAGECDLSVSVAERVLASVNAHTDEWMLHLERSLCTSLQCYYSLYIAPEACTGCKECLSLCEAGVIRGDTGMIHVLDPERCTKCGKCETGCPANAVRRAGLVRPRTPETPVPVGSFQTGGGMRKRRRKV